MGYMVNKERAGDLFIKDEHMNNNKNQNSEHVAIKTKLKCEYISRLLSHLQPIHLCQTQPSPTMRPLNNDKYLHLSQTCWLRKVNALHSASVSVFISLEFDFNFSRSPQDNEAIQTKILLHLSEPFAFFDSENQAENIAK